jgi:hypothetical protein
MKIGAWLIIAASAITLSFADVTKGNFGAARPADPEPKQEREAEPKQKRTTYPFYGTLDSINTAEKSITLRGKKKNRVILVTSQTRIFKGNSRASIQSGTPGERVSGAVQKNADGKEEAVSIRFGAQSSSK